MNSIEMEGKNIEEALKKALNELNTDMDHIEYEVLDNGSKGLFNVIGVKPAKIRVKKINNIIDDVEQFLKDLLNHMKIDAEIDIKEENDILNINISGKKMGLLIGYRGETLDSIQYLTSLFINKNHERPHKKIILDTENYRSKREQTLKGLAIKSANKVRRTKKSLKLEPMNPYERRIIHSTLQNDKYVNTYSEGEEPHRKVVINLK